MRNKYFSDVADKLMAYSLIIIFTTGLFSCTTSSSRQNTQQVTDSVSKENAQLTKKVFFLLYNMEETSPIERQIAQDSALANMYQRDRRSIQQEIKNCPNLDCLAGKLLITDAENENISTQLGYLFHTSDSIRTFINKVLRPSEDYIQSKDLPDSAFFLQVWNEQRKEFNYIINAYLKGKGLFYPTIDSASFDVNSPAYFDSVKEVITKVLAHDQDDPLFFQPTLNICLAILRLNGRNEAIRFLPLTTVNQKAYNKISHVNWKKYTYSSILVFGSGPEDPNVAISPLGKQRCRLGAALYKEGKAPFIFVSGGYVHPYRTRYCEAQEMKKFMTDSLQIPEDVIIMEPHARHTTTNIRNSNRIIFNENIPADMPVLGVTTKGHIDYIASDRFNKRCERDLGYLPFKDLKRISPTEVEYYPAKISMQINSVAPLDP